MLNLLRSIYYVLKYRRPLVSGRTYKLVADMSKDERKRYYTRLIQIIDDEVHRNEVNRLLHIAEQEIFRKTRDIPGISFNRGWLLSAEQWEKRRAHAELQLQELLKDK